MVNRTAGSPTSHTDDTVPFEPVTLTAKTKGAKPAAPSSSLSFTVPLVVALVHFALVQVAATLAGRYGTPTGSSAPFTKQLGDPIPLTGWAHLIVDPMRLWDGLWYRLVAIEGYDFSSANAAFWPLLPGVMKAGADLTGLPVDVVGYLFANICFVVALFFVYRLVAIDFPEAVARRTLWAMALFPTALFFTAVYTESPFLMLSAGALYLARRKHWLLAAVLGVLAALTRSYGVFLILPFLLLLVKEYKLNIWAAAWRMPLALSPLLGPVIFGRILVREGWEWRAFIDVQSEWNRTFAWPWETINCALNGCQLELTRYGETSIKDVRPVDWTWLGDLWGWASIKLVTSMSYRHDAWTFVTTEAFRKQVANSHSLEVVCTFLFLGLALVGLVRLPWWQSAWAIPGIVIPLFSPSTVNPLMSIPRFGITLFPLFVVMALIFRKSWLAVPAAIISGLLLVALSAQFANWFWVS